MQKNGNTHKNKLFITYCIFSISFVVLYVNFIDM